MDIEDLWKQSLPYLEHVKWCEVWLTGLPGDPVSPRGPLDPGAPWKREEPENWSERNRSRAQNP